VRRRRLLTRFKRAFLDGDEVHDWLVCDTVEGWIRTLVEIPGRKADHIEVTEGHLMISASGSCGRALGPIAYTYYGHVMIALDEP
jgi:hypothetical protein